MYCFLVFTLALSNRNSFYTIHLNNLSHLGLGTQVKNVYLPS